MTQLALTVEEYFEPDLSLIRDFYERVFLRYEPEPGERLFIMRDSHWLIGALRLRVEECYYQLRALQLLPHYPLLETGRQLLEHVCQLVDDRPLFCQAQPFEMDLYREVGFSCEEIARLPEPLRSQLQRQQAAGYLVLPLMRPGRQLAD